MNKNELVKKLAHYDIIPKKHWGQNFLIDNNILNLMMKSIDFSSGAKNILEVGPGCGILSHKILEKGCNLTVIEIDKKIHNYLEDTLAGHSNFRLIKGDACRLDIDDIMNLPQSFRCISNLPYAISSVFISRLLECLSPPEEAFFLLQEEMALRLVAKPKTKDYNSLSIRVQTFYDVKILKKIPPSVFYPSPKVNSAFLSLKKRTKKYLYYNALSQLTKLVFSLRRKKFVKVAKNLYTEEALIDSLEKVGLEINIRPEEISVEKFQKIVTNLQNS